MLIPLALSYHNIGPFTGHNILITLSNGSFLIKAAIGSGKSFLYFDGPLFALYKHRERPMLNKNSKKGAIEIAFSIDEQVYLIRRDLSLTSKGGESIKTKLWLININISDISTYIPQHTNMDMDGPQLTELLPSHILEPIEATTQKENDALISQLLPPKEVVLSTGFLTQSAESVFELGPADRIQVFKHMFGLLGIDEGKEKLNDARKELQAKINVLGDQSNANTKLQKLTQDILQTATHIENLMHQLEESSRSENPTLQGGESVSHLDKVGLEGIHSYIFTLLSHEDLKDLKLLPVEQLTIEGLQRKGRDIALFEDIHTYIAQQLSTHATLSGQLLSTKQQLQQHTTTKNKLTQDLESAKRQREQIHSQIQQIDTSELTTLQTQQLELQTTSQAIEDKLPWDIYTTYMPDTNNTKEATPLDISRSIEQTLADGKLLRQTETYITEQISQLDKEKIQRETRKTQLEEQVQSSQTSKQEQTIFSCDKIDDVCPYVHLINKKATQALDKQIDNAQQILQQHIANKPDRNQKKTELDRKFAQTKEDMSSKGAFLKAVSWKETQEQIKQRQHTQQQIQQTQQRRDALQKKADQITHLQTQYIEANQKVESLTKQIQDHETQSLDIYTKTTTLQKQTEDIPTDTYKHCDTYISQLQQASEQLRQLISEHAASQLELKKLKDKLVKTKELYQIFSKELMIVVLQDFLPSLQEVLNSYLAQLVDYQVKFRTPNSDGDQLELDIDVIDEKGAREVKSLSGGQKTILKLVWMLSVATMMNSKFLFLDETINNLDSETVALVAEVLKDFVASRQLMFFVVTHSTTIQQMDIWDKTLAL